MDARIPVTIGHVKVAARRDRQVGPEIEGWSRPTNFTVVDARGSGIGKTPADSERQKQLAVRGELLDGVVEIVDAVDRVVRADGDPVRPLDRFVSPRTDEISFGGEDGDGTFSSIEDVGSVIGIGRDSRNLDEFGTRRQAGPLFRHAITKGTSTEYRRH